MALCPAPGLPEYDWDNRPGRLMGTSVHLTFAIFVFTIIKTPNFIKQALLTTHGRLVLSVCVIGSALGLLRARIRVMSLLMAAETDDLEIGKTVFRIHFLYFHEFLSRD